MNDEHICLRYVNLPSHFYLELVNRGFINRSLKDPTENTTICVKIKPGDLRYYPIPPDYGEAVIETLDELDTLLMLKRLGDDNVLREYIKATHKICGVMDE